MQLNVEQNRLVSAELGGQMLIKGVAGSGKTTVALHRALHLQLNCCKNPEDLVLLITYNTALINYLAYIYKKIENEHGVSYSNSYSSAKDKVIKRTIDSLIFEHYRSIAENSSLKSSYFQGEVRKIFRNCISEVKKDYANVALLDSRNSQFLIDEIDWIKSCNYMDISEYQKVDRIGRTRFEKYNEPQRLAKNSIERQAIFDLMQHFDRRVKESGYIYYKDVALLVNRFALKNPQKKYKHIIVDEGQDLSRVQLEFIKSLYLDGPYSSFTFVADTAQSIYPHAWLIKGRSFSSVGFDMTGKSYTLSKNYRTSVQAAQAAYSMIEDDNNIVGCDEYVPPELIDRQGQYPVLSVYDTERSESNGVVSSIRRLLSQGYEFRDIAVIAREKQRLESIKETLDDNDLPCSVYTSNDDAFGENCIQLLTMHAIKGLEYKVVFIITINENVIPYLSDHMKESLTVKESNERKLLYVGMTRAREQLFISYYNKPSKFLLNINPKYLRSVPDKRIRSFYKVAVDDYIYKNDIRKHYGREEEVRQWVARELMQTYGYLKTMIQFERKVGYGSRRLSLDLTILANNKGAMVPFIIFETKAPGSDLPDGFEQLKSYMESVPTCQYGVLTDGQYLSVWNRDYDLIDDIPVFQQSMLSYGGDTFIFSFLDSSESYTFKIDYGNADYVAVGNRKDQVAYSGKDVVKVPIFERVAAGNSQIIDERVAGYFSLPAEWFKDLGNMFILKVKGDSMVNAGIDDGDHVVVKEQNTAYNKKIVVVGVGDEAIIKIYNNTGKTVMLESANPKYAPYHVITEQAHILGVAVGVIKGK